MHLWSFEYPLQCAWGSSCRPSWKFSLRIKLNSMLIVTKSLPCTISKAQLDACRRLRLIDFKLCFQAFCFQKMMVTHRCQLMIESRRRCLKRQSKMFRPCSNIQSLRSNVAFNLTKLFWLQFIEISQRNNHWPSGERASRRPQIQWNSQYGVFDQSYQIVRATYDVSALIAAWAGLDILRESSKNRV